MGPSHSLLALFAAGRSAASGSARLDFLAARYFRTAVNRTAATHFVAAVLAAAFLFAASFFAASRGAGGRSAGLHFFARLRGTRSASLDFLAAFHRAARPGTAATNMTTFAAAGLFAASLFAASRSAGLHFRTSLDFLAAMHGTARPGMAATNMMTTLLAANGFATLFTSGGRTSGGRTCLDCFASSARRGLGVGDADGEHNRYHHQRRQQNTTVHGRTPC